MTKFAAPPESHRSPLMFGHKSETTRLSGYRRCRQVSTSVRGVLPHGIDSRVRLGACPRETITLRDSGLGADIQPTVASAVLVDWLDSAI